MNAASDTRAEPAPWTSIPSSMLAAPPRPTPQGGQAAVARNVSPAVAIGGVALSCFSFFYGVVFYGLEAPRGLLLSFLAPGAIGLMVLLGWSAAVWRGLSLLRRGRCVLGEIDSVSKAGGTLGSPSLLVHYSFRPAPNGDKVARKTTVRELPGLLQAPPGEPIPVCYDPRRPARSMALPGLHG